MRHCECAVKLSLVYEIESPDGASKNKYKYSNNEGSSTPSPYGYWLRVLAHIAWKKSKNRKKNNSLINSSLKDIIQWILSGKLKEEMSETGRLRHLITESAERNW